MLYIFVEISVWYTELSIFASFCFAVNCSPMDIDFASFFIRLSFVIADFFNHLC